MDQGIPRPIGTHHHQPAPLAQEPLALQLVQCGRDANPACADHAGLGLVGHRHSDENIVRLRLSQVIGQLQEQVDQAGPGPRAQQCSEIASRRDQPPGVSR